MEGVFLSLVLNTVSVMFQNKYKEEGLKDAAISLYHVMPDTMQTQHAREAEQLRSEVGTVDF